MYTKAYYNGVLVNDLQYQYSSILNKFDVASIYANGEQGFWFDPNDLSTMYQDATGTNPVTGVGQPVGLVLDKSKGLIRGAELWNHSSALALGESSIVSTNTYRIKSTDGSSSYVYCSGFSTSKFYEVSFDIVSITGSISTDVEVAPVWSTVGRKKFIGKPLGGWLTIKRSGVCDAVVANISVKEIAGNHAYQTTSAARPIFRQKPILGNELVVNGDFSVDTSGWVGASSTLSRTASGSLRISATSVNYPSARQTIKVTPGKEYVVSFKMRSVDGTSARMFVRSLGYDDTSNQYASTVYKGTDFTQIQVTVKATTDSFYIRLTLDGVNVSGAIEFDDISIREVTGYRTDQNYIEYDGVDDKLITNLPAQLTGCTVVRAIPNEGTKILYNQTLPASYEDTMNHSGFFAINRALSNSEKVLLLNAMDKRTGITSLDSQVARSFANNEVGVAFNDFNDLSVLYQDAAGTLPVTAVGQPVGLIVDKSKGLELGPEKVINGGLTTLTGWETPVTAPASVTLVAGGVRLYSPAGEAATLRQQVVLKRGGWYKVQFNVKSITGSGYIALYSGTAGLQRYDFSTPGVKTIYLQAAPTGDYLLISRSTICDFVISDVSVKELSGNHAYQSTSSMRPILRQNAITGANYLEFDGSDDFLQTGNIDFTTTDKVSLFAGLRKLSDALTGTFVELSSNVNNSNGSFFIGAPFLANANNFGTLVRGSTAQTGKSFNDRAAPVSTVLGLRFSIGDKYVKFRETGRESSSSNFNFGGGYLGQYPLYIGRRAGTALPFNGHLYSLIIMGRLASDTETVVLEKAIAKQIGVTLNV